MNPYRHTCGVPHNEDGTPSKFSSCGTCLAEGAWAEGFAAGTETQARELAEAKAKLAAADKIIRLVHTRNCCDGEDARRTDECDAALSEYFATLAAALAAEKT